jgi:acetyltransferase
MEFALVVRDAWQGQGVGKLLLQSLIDLGRLIGLQRITADVLPENLEMVGLAKHLGFTFTRDEEENLLKGQLKLE